MNETGYLIPTVIEKTGAGERAYDIFSRLLKDRIIMVTGPITTDSSSLIIAQLLFLQGEDTEKDVHMYINSPGGEVTATMAMYDTMNFIKPDVATYCIGPNARVMIHQPLGGAEGQASDIEIRAKEINRMKEDLLDLMVKHTGKKKSDVEKDMDRDFFMSAEEACKYGIVDKVIEPKQLKNNEKKN
jgi:ATP-dependent Clp protease protease subunit